MKRLCAILTAVCLMCTGGFGLVSASAVSNSSENIIIGNGNVTIVPFASADISQITYSVTSSKYSADITLRRSCSGSVYLELQKKSGTSWNYKDSTSSTFSSKFFTSASKSLSVTESGTYRLYIEVTIDGVTTVRQSGEFPV